MSQGRREGQPPILAGKRHQAPSLLTPESLLREARRQKGLAPASVPRVCVLDPDGDIVEHLLAEGRARRDTSWACYHTDLYRFEVGRNAIGIVGRAVGAPFAVLVAEELFASGCAAAQHHVVGADRLAGSAALLRLDRAGAAGRGHQLPLPASR